MMYRKAEIFQDRNTADLILNAIEPREQRRLGRLVKNFDQDLWDKLKLAIVIHGNMLKFQQNSKWAQQLVAIIQINKSYFVEASPCDKVWGIGINSEQAKAGVAWQGENLLGIALTNVAFNLLRADQLQYVDDIHSIASAGVDGINAELKKYGVDSERSDIVNLIEDDLYQIIDDFLEEHLGIGEYSNHN